MKTKINGFILYPLLLFIGFSFMCVGYAAINSTTLEVTGDVVAQAQSGIFITDVVYTSDNNADVANSKIKSYYQAIMNSHITLSNSSDSSITYTVTLHNNDTEDYYYKGTKYDSEFYDNSNIGFTVSGINVGDTISAGGNQTFTITFSYVDGTNITNTELNSYINFSFGKKYNVTYEGFSDTSSYPTYVFQDDSLSYNFGVADYQLSIYMGDNLLTKSDYTYDNGTVTINDVTGNLKFVYSSSSTINDNIVPVTITDDEGNGAGIQIGDFKSKYISGSSISSTAQNRLTVSDEKYDQTTNTYTINITKKFAWGQFIFNPTIESFNLNFKLTNSSNYDWTNVTSINPTTSGYLSSVSSSLDKNTITIGDSGTLNMKFTLQIVDSSTETLNYKITFMAGGAEQTVNVIINFT